jgi:transposase
MEERLKFIARLLDGEKMAVVCREFGISRKTGYKILTRYNAIGLDGLTDRSRRPYPGRMLAAAQEDMPSIPAGLVHHSESTQLGQRLKNS